MCRKIWCDEKFLKLCKIFEELNMAFVVHMYTYLTKLSSFSIHCHRDMTKTCILCSGSITQMQFFFVTLWLDYVTNPCCTGSITLYIYTTMHEKVRGGGNLVQLRTYVCPTLFRLFEHGSTKTEAHAARHVPIRCGSRSTGLRSRSV
jgi:hypothetical protein